MKRDTLIAIAALAIVARLFIRYRAYGEIASGLSQPSGLLDAEQLRWELKNPDWNEKIAAVTANPFRPM